MPSMPAAAPELAAEVAAAQWYHTLELPGGIVTPGMYDLRKAATIVPMPASLAGKRCLDVGTRDGFWAFEMERRGADEVVGIDLDDPADYDWPLPRRHLGEEEREFLAQSGDAFGIAHRAFGSKVERRDVSVYDLPESGLGRFDFAFVGTLLLHLRDPVGALAAVNAVLDGELVVNDVVSLSLSLLRRGPAAALLTEHAGPYWWTPNAAGLRRYIQMAGYEVTSSGRPYFLSYGAGLRPPPLSLRFSLSMQILHRLGAPHVWVAARPAAEPAA